MDDEEVKRRHAAACSSLEHREKLRRAATGKRHTLESREKMSKIQKQIYSNPELRRKVKLNQPTVISVKMLDEQDNVIREFDSLTDVCRYFNKDQGNTSALHSVLDKFNKKWEACQILGPRLDKI